MKKYLFLLIILILCGCSNVFNTPSGCVTEYLNKYQDLDKSMLLNVDSKISKLDIPKSLREDYKSLLINGFKNMSFKITKEEEYLDEAKVYATIEVFDYSSSIRESKKYYKDHSDEFDSDKAFYSYMIDNMKLVKKKIKYDIEFDLIKIDNKWVIDEVGDDTVNKIYGIYEE